MIAKLMERYLTPYAFFDINMDVLPMHSSIPQYLFEFSESLSEWKVFLKSNTDKTSHFELPNTENVSFNNGYAKLFLAILTFKCSKICY